MITLLWGIGLLVITWASHLLLWRLCPPRNHTTFLLLLFFTLPFPLVAASVALGVPSPQTPLGWLHVASLYIPCALTYIIAYSAIEHESPTCQMVRLIESSGPEGIAPDRLIAIMAPEKMIEVRLHSLHDTGGAAYESGTYHLLPKGQRMAQFFTLVARIFGIRSHGG